MKRSILAALVMCGMITAATSASAYVVGTTDVGGLDTLMASAKLDNSSDAYEIDWVNAVLGTSYTEMVKYDNTSAGWNWAATDVANVYASNLNGAPEYYFIKTAAGLNGTPKTDFDHFLFDNNTSIEWAVVNLNTSFGPDYEIKGFGKFSHIGELGGSPVPEPSTIILLGVGLIGLAAHGRKRIQK